MQNILKLPYILSLFFLKKFCYFFWKIEIWPRHSYVLNSFIAGKSDLDISAYVENKKHLTTFLEFYEFYKKLIPFMGELVIYTPELVTYLNKYDLNGFEIERDPILINKFNFKIKKDSSFTYQKASVYLQMLLINDYHKLRAEPLARYKKWQQHFNHIKESMVTKDSLQQHLQLNEQMLLFSIFSAIIILNPHLNAAEKLFLRTQLRLYIELLLDDNLEDRDRWLKPLIADSRSHFYPFFVEYLCHVEGQRPQITNAELDNICSQIDWFLLKMLRQSYKKSQVEADIKRIQAAKNDFELFSLQAQSEMIASTSRKISEALLILQTRI